MATFTNHQPLDFLKEYSIPVSKWLQQDNEYGTELEKRITIYMTAIHFLQDATGLTLDRIKSKLRHEPFVHVAIDLSQDQYDDSEALSYWFIFKEDNNGTTHKVKLSHSDIENFC